MEESRLAFLLRIALATAFTCAAVKYMFDKLDPTRDQKNKAKKQAKAILNKLNIKTGIQVRLIKHHFNCALISSSS